MAISHFVRSKQKHPTQANKWLAPSPAGGAQAITFFQRGLALLLIEGIILSADPSTHSPMAKFPVG